MQLSVDCSWTRGSVSHHCAQLCSTYVVGHYLLRLPSWRQTMPTVGLLPDGLILAHSSFLLSNTEESSVLVNNVFVLNVKHALLKFLQLSRYLVLSL